MNEKAAHAVRTKRDSSMRVGLKLVREGNAAGFVTAGNTGAAMATAMMVLGDLGTGWMALARLFGNFYASLGEPFTHVRKSFEEWEKEQGK